VQKPRGGSGTGHWGLFTQSELLKLQKSGQFQSLTNSPCNLPLVLAMKFIMNLFVYYKWRKRDLYEVYYESMKGKLKIAGIRCLL
jgi:hypothetical protein